MSLRVRALCPTPVGDLTPEKLHSGIADRLAVLAAYYGEEGAEETLACLRVSGDGDGALSLRYRDDTSPALRVERCRRPAAVAAEVGALRADLEACDEEGVDEVRELLDRVVETVGIELPMSDVEGIGWAVAVAAAACFAEHAEGLIQADGEGWMMPEGRGVEQVLDGD
jgi:hypothetical protein